MFLFFCLQALAQEPDTDSAATDTEQITISSTPKSSSLTEIVVVLHNGVVLKGQAELTALLTWSPGSELTFTPEGGEQITLKGELVASVQNADAQIAPAPLQPQPAPSTSQATPEAETEELKASFTRRFRLLESCCYTLSLCTLSNTDAGGSGLCFCKTSLHHRCLCTDR